MLTQKCNNKMWFEKYLCALWEHCVNLVMHLWSSVCLTNFNLNCSMGYFFCSISTWNYFLLFLQGFLYIWLYYILWFWFDPETGARCLLRNLLLLFSQLSWSHYTHFFQLFVKIFIFAGFVLVALIHLGFIWYW